MPQHTPPAPGFSAPEGRAPTAARARAISWRPIADIIAPTVRAVSTYKPGQSCAGVLGSPFGLRPEPTNVFRSASQL